MSDTKISFVLQGWPTKEDPPAKHIQVIRDGKPEVMELPAPTVLPQAEVVKQWCRDGKKVRVTYEVVG